MSGAKPRDVDEYIARAPAETRAALAELRAIIRAAAPAAEERISYGMPYYFLNGRLAYFSLHTHHIGLYPADRAAAGAAGLTSHFAEKSSLQFRARPTTARRFDPHVHRTARRCHGCAAGAQHQGAMTCRPPDTAVVSSSHSKDW